MTGKNNQEYTSDIGSGYLHPISSLLEKLNSLEVAAPNEVKVSTLEFSYSAAVILLAVVFVESITNTAQKFCQPPKSGRFLPPVEYLDEAYIKPPYSEEVLKEASELKEELKEAIAVRHAIAHSHIWTTQFYNDDENQGELKLDSTNIEQGSGSKEYRERIEKTGATRTSKLKINLIPTKLCRKDVKILLQSVLRFLQFLEQHNSKLLGILNRPVEHCGQLTLFTDLVENIKT
jgi:hypothetical protein